MKRAPPQPPHTRRTFHRRLQPPYTEKNTVSCSGFLPKTNPKCNIHAPLQCVLQHRVANTHLSTHMATKRDTNHAAIPLRSATTASKHPKTRTNEQPPVAEHTGRTDLTMKRVQLHPPHTWRYLFIAGCSHLTRKKNTVSCSGFLPKQTPCNIHAPITMRFALSRGKHASFYAHGNKCDTNHAAIPLRSATTTSKTSYSYAHMNNHSLQNTQEEPI